MKTVEECQKFLVNFFTNTPGLVSGIYNPQEGAIALKDALIAENWVQNDVFKPGSENSRLEGTHYHVWTQGAQYPRGPHYYEGAPLDKNKVAFERIFTLKEEFYDDAVIFIILETSSGKLYVGDYIGD